MNSRVLTHALLVTLLIALSSWSVAASDPDRRWPTKWSELDGWNGLRVEKQVDFKNQRKLCYLRFPADYGTVNDEQFTRLLRLAREGYKIDVDLDCYTSINYEVLGHIRFLAIQKQFRKAVLAILGPHRNEELRLDGEIAEEFAGDYILPTLERYERLSSILSPEIEDSLAHEICGWAIPREEMKRVRIAQSDLTKRGYTSLAKKIAAKCAN